MKFVKEDESPRRDYILQKDEKTKKTSTFIIVVLIVLGIAVVASGIYFLKA